MGEELTSRLDVRNEPRQPPICSFCSKAKSEAAKLISNPKGSAYICDECIATRHFILQEEEPEWRGFPKALR